MKLKAIIRVTGLLLLSSIVFAVGEQTFNFDPPTEYEDGTPLPQTEIAFYEIECDGVLLANFPNVPLNTNTYFAPPGTFSVGNHSCQAFTISDQGIRSGPSNTINFTVAPGTPSPPINFVVQ